MSREVPLLASEKIKLGILIVVVLAILIPGVYAGWKAIVKNIAKDTDGYEKAMEDVEKLYYFDVMSYNEDLRYFLRLRSFLCRSTQVAIEGYERNSTAMTNDHAARELNPCFIVMKTEPAIAEALYKAAEAEYDKLNEARHQLRCYRHALGSILDATHVQYDSFEPEASC